MQFAMSYQIECTGFLTSFARWIRVTLPSENCTDALFRMASAKPSTSSAAAGASSAAAGKQWEKNPKLARFFKKTETAPKRLKSLFQFYGEGLNLLFISFSTRLGLQRNRPRMSARASTTRTTLRCTN